MPTMKIEMTIPELQSFIATNRVNIEWREDTVYCIKEALKDWYEDLNDWMQNNPNSKDYPDGIENCIHFIKEDKRELNQHRRDLAHYVKLQIAAKKALRKAYEDERKKVVEHKKNAEKFFNVIVC